MVSGQFRNKGVEKQATDVHRTLPTMYKRHTGELPCHPPSLSSLLRGGCASTLLPSSFLCLSQGLAIFKLCLDLIPKCWDCIVCTFLPVYICVCVLGGIRGQIISGSSYTIQASLEFRLFQPWQPPPSPGASITGKCHHGWPYSSLKKKKKNCGTSYVCFVFYYVPSRFLPRSGCCATPSFNAWGALWHGYPLIYPVSP